MHWVIQSDIYKEENYVNLTATLERFGLSYSVHKIVPFAGTLDPEPNIQGPVIVLGSYSLARQAHLRGWTPGAFTANLDFQIQRAHWHDRMLNADAKIYAFGDIPFQREPFFVRPTRDTKAYTGIVVDWGEYEKWRDSLERAPETNDPVNDPLGVSVHALTDSTMVCAKKSIWSETRTWVVDGHVVTYSGFKVGTLQRYTGPEAVDQRVVDFANECAQLWSPNRAYVLDVAETAHGLKIGEVNNLNAAGWYRCDMQKLVMALENMA